MRQMRPATAGVAHDVPLAQSIAKGPFVPGPGPHRLSPGERKSNSRPTGEKDVGFPFSSCAPMHKTCPSRAGKAMGWRWSRPTFDAQQTTIIPRPVIAEMT